MEEKKKIEVRENMTEGEREVKSAGVYTYSEKDLKPKKKRRKGLITFLVILGVIVLLGVLAAVKDIGGDDADLSGAADVSEEFIGVLYVEGEISSSGGTYDHEYALDAVDGMMENDDNEALILYIDSPGGNVYESDELYLKIKEYRETTKRPVCAYFGSQATSGGYYIAAPADRIIANRNCWTGSIGVTIGNLFDVSELLEEHGIKVTTITSGDNKAMGDITAPLTSEQKKIFQDLVDEAYDQFVNIVADGRDLDVKYVKKIADGRLYTAKQAQEMKLVDSVSNTFDDAMEEFKRDFELEDYDVYDFRYEEEYDILGSFIKSIEKAVDSSSGSGDVEALTELMEKDGRIQLQYMCEVTK